MQEVKTLLNKNLLTVIKILLLILTGALGILISISDGNFTLKLLLILVGLSFGVPIIINRPEFIIPIILFFQSTLPFLKLVDVVNLGLFDIRLWEFLTLIGWILAFMFISNKKRLGLISYDWMILIVIVTILFAAVMNALQYKYPINQIILFILNTVVAGWGIYYIVSILVNRKNLKFVLWSFLALGAFTSLGTVIVEVTRDPQLYAVLFPVVSEAPSYSNLSAYNLRLTSPAGLGLVVIAFAISTAIFYFSPNKKEKIAALGMMTIYLLHNVAAASRGLIVISVFLILFGILLSFKHLFRPRTVLLAAVIFGLSVILLGQVNRIWMDFRGESLTQVISQRLNDATSNTISDAWRLEISKAAFQEFLKYPLTGYGVYGFAMWRNVDWNYDVNGLIAIPVNYGIFGLFSFLILFYGISKSSILAIIKRRDLEIDNLPIMISIAFGFGSYLLLCFSSLPFTLWPSPLAFLLGIYKVASTKNA